MIRVGLVGMNFHSHGPQIYKSILKQRELFEVAGYCLPENEREKYPEKVAFLADLPERPLEEMLADPTIDAMVIETDEIYLTKYALLAAKAGKHVHMEKPGGQDMGAFAEMIAAMRESGKVFHTGYMYRYNPEIIHLLRRIEEGELGEIISVEAQMNCIQKDFVREWLARLSGGQMFFLGCHLVDLIYRIKGAPKRILPLSTDNEYGFVVFEYDNGISFAKTHAAEKGGYARRQLVVTGSKKTVELKPLEMGSESDMYTVCTEYESTSWGNRGESHESEHYDRYDFMMASFAAYVCGEKENPYTLDYELALYRLVLAACGLN